MNLMSTSPPSFPLRHYTYCQYSFLSFLLPVTPHKSYVFPTTTKLLTVTLIWFSCCYYSSLSSSSPSSPSTSSSSVCQPQVNATNTLGFPSFPSPRTDHWQVLVVFSRSSRAEGTEACCVEVSLLGGVRDTNKDRGRKKKRDKNREREREREQ